MGSMVSAVFVASYAQGPCDGRLRLIPRPLFRVQGSGLLGYVEWVGLISYSVMIKV